MVPLCKLILGFPSTAAYQPYSVYAVRSDQIMKQMMYLWSHNTVEVQTSHRMVNFRRKSTYFYIEYSHFQELWAGVQGLDK
jgi:hypothetical protein